MELADVKSFADMLLAACEETEKAGRSSLDTNFFLKKNRKMKRKDMTRIAKNVYERLHDPLTLPGFIEADWTASLPFLSPDLHELSVWFDRLRKETDKSLQDRIRDRFYQLLFCQMKNICDCYTGDGVQALADMIPNSGNSDKVSFKEQLPVYIENGERYHSLSNDLGRPGTLFLLPNKGESYWLSKVPKGATSRGQKTRISVLESLKQTGISNKAIELRTHAVAAKILNDSLSVFRGALASYLGACSGANSNAQYVSHQPSPSLNCLFYAPRSDAQALQNRRPDASCSREPHKRRCTGDGVTSGFVGAEDVLSISTQETESVALSLHPEGQHKRASRATNRDLVPDEPGTRLSPETILVQAHDDSTNNPLRTFMAPFVMEPTDHVQPDAYGSSILPADHPQTNTYDLNIVPANYPQIYPYDPNLEPDDHPLTNTYDLNIVPANYPQIYPYDPNLEIYPYELDDILAVTQRPYTPPPETSQSSCFPWSLSVSSAELFYPEPRVEVI